MNSRQFATLVVITFFVGMIWLAADIIFNTKASVPISEKLQGLLQPVSPNFNARVLEIIHKETLDSDSVVVKAPSASTPAPSPSANPSSTPRPSSRSSAAPSPLGLSVP